MSEVIEYNSLVDSSEPVNSLTEASICWALGSWRGNFFDFVAVFQNGLGAF